MKKNLNFKECRVTRKILKKNKVGRLTLVNIETCYKVKVIKQW